MTERLSFDGLTIESFSVDSARRIMTGVIVPWNKVGKHNNGRKWRFTRGGVKYADPKFIRLNEDHVHSARLGRAISVTDTEEGLVAAFRIYETPLGDRALANAQDYQKTGFSVEVEIDQADTESDPENPGVLLVNMAHLEQVAFLENPAFTEARLISVRAGADQGAIMKCTKCNLVHADGVTECVASQSDTSEKVYSFSEDQFNQLIAGMNKPVGPVDRPVVDPTQGHTVAVTEVTEPVSYAFSRTGAGSYVFSAETEHDFSTDILSMINHREMGRDYGTQMSRVNDFIQKSFADVEIADLPGSLLSQRRPEMWVPQRDYATPLWDLTGRGAPPNGSQKFDIPKFTSSSALVAVAVEKTEPAGGSFVDELQTITPGQLWGKAEITRQVWREGGNPAFSGILWAQFLREFYEDREAAIATFLGTLTAATDIALTGTPASADNDDYKLTMSDFEQAYADLQFARGGNRFDAFAVHQALYRVGTRVKDDMGRPMYPILNPSNANGVTASRYRTIDVAGSTWIPAYALGTVSTTSTNSWLFDSDVVMTWAGAPERLFWDFGSTVQTSNIPQLSFVTLGLYADYAVANTDIAGVRQVTFDPNTDA